MTGINTNERKAMISALFDQQDLHNSWNIIQKDSVGRLNMCEIFHNVSSFPL